MKYDDDDCDTNGSVENKQGTDCHGEKVSLSLISFSNFGALRFSISGVLWRHRLKRLGASEEILELELLLEQGFIDLEIFFETLDTRLKEVVENL